MIHADGVVPMLLAAVPSFAERWQEVEVDPIHFDEDEGSRLHYADAGEFARHLVQLRRHGATEELRRAFDVIEALHVDGDEYVRELATIGYLEAVQTAASHTDDVSASDFERYLGLESARWWVGLNDFWAGRAAVVQPGLPVLVIDGDLFDDFDGFVREFSRRLDDFAWNGSLDAFNDILRGGCGTPDGASSSAGSTRSARERLSDGLPRSAGSRRRSTAATARTFGGSPSNDGLHDVTGGPPCSTGSSK